MTRFAQRMGLLMGFLVLAAGSGCGGTDDKRAKCEKIADKAVEWKLQENRSKGADDARIKEIQVTLANGKAAYVAKCMGGLDSVVDCASRAGTQQEAAACMRGGT